jgi:hypothetical protein
MGQVIDNLRAEIRKLYRESLDKSGSTDHPERRYFVNVEALKTLFTREIIAEAIKECNVKDYERPAVANRIFTEGKVVFGILIWRKWHRKLQSFIEHNTLDKQLPLDEEQAKAIAGTSGFGLEFARKAQWEFLPRILTKEMSGYHCHFRDEEVFPFVAETELGEGTFGEVTKISVMPSLQTIFPKSV